MNYNISHKTLYTYATQVIQSRHLVHMSPRAVLGQSIVHHSLIVEPAPAQRFEGVDAFGNNIVILDVEVPHTELVVLARSTIATEPAPDMVAGVTAPWDAMGSRLQGADGALDLDVIQYQSASRLTMPTLDIDAYGAVSFAAGRPVLEAVMDLTLRIFSDFKFDPTATDISTPISEVLRLRRGVCQDLSHLALACLRARGVPARYVSGYLLTQPPPGQPRLQGADASHAWLSVWAPETGWVGFDPTNGKVAGDEHIAFAFGRDFEDVSPISGILIGGGDHTVNVEVDVVPAG